MPKVLLLLSLLLFGLAGPLYGQECSPPPITPNSKNYNIFSPEQEMILGDLTHEQAAGDWRFVSDAGLTEYLNQIGDRLIKHLPATGLKFRFFIIDIPEANAFNVPGGYVYVTRKLVAMTNNEDELAGVMAHELGHAVARHAASDFSRQMKKILNVTLLGDRRDIAEKYNLLIERMRTKHVSANDDPAQEYEADRIGVFAMAAAGYDPDAALSFTARLVEARVKGGNWLSDIFGNASHDEKLLREILKTAERLPAACREKRHTTASEVFLKWQADVISYREQKRNEDLPGLLWKKELSPKLRSDISRFTFSQDGRFFLAQDDFAVTVLQREPLQVMFQIPATEVEEASFTPDNKHVVFGTKNLRFEKWSLESKEPVEIRELSVRDDCWEDKFSPDGRYLACVDYALGLNVVDTHSGNKVWEKKEFYSLNVWELLVWRWAQSRDERAGKSDSFFHLEFSPDGHYLVVSRSGGFRSRETEDTMLTLDLNTLKTLSTGGELKKVTRRAFLFLDSNRILAMGHDKVEDGGIFSFPEGKRLAKFSLAARELKRTENPNYVVVKPLGDFRMGIFDLTKGEAVGGMKTMDAAL